MPKEDKQDEQKTQRFNMFMSPSEMEAIDDWAWKHRIRSKSEAVRRLCQVGLEASFRAERLETFKWSPGAAIGDVGNAVARAFKAAGDVPDGSDLSGDSPEVVAYRHANSTAIATINDALTRAFEFETEVLLLAEAVARATSPEAVSEWAELLAVRRKDEEARSADLARKIAAIMGLDK